MYWQIAEHRQADTGSVDQYDVLMCGLNLLQCSPRPNEQSNNIKLPPLVIINKTLQMPTVTPPTSINKKRSKTDTVILNKTPSRE